MHLTPPFIVSLWDWHYANDMAVNLNLLPPELTVSKTLNKLLNASRAFSVISVTAFLVFTVIVGALFVVNTISIRGLKTKNTNLQSQIKNQEASEQQLILVKDRIKKISLVQSVPSSAKSLTDIEPVLSAVSGNSSVNEFNTTQDKIGLTLGFRSNSDLTNFMKTISISTAFKSIVMSSFGFSPLTGYTVSFDLIRK